MGSIRTLVSKGTLFMDFRYAGQRIREYTVMPDTPANRKRLQKALDRIEAEIALCSFDYAKTFGKPLLTAESAAPGTLSATSGPSQNDKSRCKDTPLFKAFADQWFTENEVSWRRSYQITQRCTLEKYLHPHFGLSNLSSIGKSDILAFRASLAKVLTRKGQSTLSNRRINAVIKLLRQILNEAADRFEFSPAFRNVKPLKTKRIDVQPFTLEEVQLILTKARPDYRNYFTVRFLTGMRTGEVHGLKWKYIDFERRLILVRESIVLGEEDDLKTESSMRDIQMSQIVFDALSLQYEAVGKSSEFVFCNRLAQPLDNKNFVNRVWTPLLRHLGLAHRRAYQMRHTAATLWLAAGEAPEWIARQLGHTSTEMLFRVYSRYVPNLTRQDGSAMDRLLTRHISTPSGSGMSVAAARPSTPKPFDPTAAQPPSE